MAAPIRRNSDAGRLFFGGYTWLCGTIQILPSIYPGNSLSVRLHGEVPLQKRNQLIFSASILGLASLLLVACGGVSSSMQRTSGLVVSPSSDSIGIGANRQFTATVNGVATANVTWSVVASGGGTIDSTGLYIAPATIPSPATVTLTATEAGGMQTSAMVTVLGSDPLGTVTASATTTCPPGGVDGGTCYQTTVSCDGVADLNTYLKVNSPAGTPLGTVMFGIGSGGNGLYDTGFQFGTTAVQNVLLGGYTTVQVSFGQPFTDATPNGWLTGPGGVRRLACRYATISQWVHDNIHVGSTTAPMCATGNSAGSGAVAYAISHYGMDSIFSFVETTSGPPMARIDQGCICSSNVSEPTNCNQGTLPMCYGVQDSQIIDTAYPQPLCTNAVNGNVGANLAGLFLSDSLIDGATTSFNFPKTNVHVLFGGQDNSAAVPQGTVWAGAVTSNKSQACVPDAPHPIPDVLDGATTIASDILSLCKLQP